TEQFQKSYTCLGIARLRQRMMREHLVADQTSLTAINSEAAAAYRRSTAHAGVLAAVVFQENKIVIAKGHQPICFGEILEHDVRFAVRSKGERLQRRRAMLIDRWIGLF